VGDLAHPALSGWENFYVIVGSSSAALIGLQFVVIALVADTHLRSTSETLGAFATPTVVHLGGALLISAIMSAPWATLFAVALALGCCGMLGLGYCTSVLIRARRQTGYAPVLEDWIWHTILPFTAYGALTLSALLLRGAPREWLFVIAAATLGLLLIAIHNAWDTVTYIVTQQPNDRTGQQ
jgi:hypothetical protein